MRAMIYLKDALLCLFICSTLANLNNNKKTATLSLGLVIILFLMGIDL